MKKTPLLNFEGIYAKWEGVNPTGSIKDRMAAFIVEEAEKKGLLRKGWTIIEATSGNTGIAFSYLAKLKGYKMVAVMPEGIGKQKKKIMKKFGARIITTPKEKGFEETIKTTKRLATPKTFLPAQFENPLNSKAQELSLGKELLLEVKKPEAFIAGIGTGGTIMGVGKALKKIYPRLKLFGVSAAEEEHGIEGISDGITPKILDQTFLDKTLKIKTKDAIKKTKEIIKRTGIPVGISSGANLLAAEKVKEKLHLETVVTVFPDRAERYPELW